MTAMTTPPQQGITDAVLIERARASAAGLAKFPQEQSTAGLLLALADALEAPVRVGRLRQALEPFARAAARAGDQLVNEMPLNDKNLGDLGLTLAELRYAGSVLAWDRQDDLAMRAAQPTADVGERLFAAIKHGDDEHQAWLREAIAAFFAGGPVPPVRGQGRKEAEIVRLRAEIKRLTAQPGQTP